MTNKQQKEKRERAGSTKRDQLHRVGGDWTSLKLPAGLNVWKPKEGIFRLDIIPYLVKNNPLAETGKWYYERTYYRHNPIGPDNSMYCCLAKNWKKPCPICEHRSSLANRADGDKETQDLRAEMVKSLEWKERQCWLVYDLDAPEKGVQLLDISNYGFGLPLDEERHNAAEGEDHISQFDDHDAGSTLKIRFKEGQFKNFFQAVRIDFIPRSKGINPKLLDHGYCLDDLPVEVVYDELKEIFLQVGKDDEQKPDDDQQTPEPEEDEIPFDEPETDPKSEAEKAPEPAAVADDDEDDDWG